MYQIDFNKPQNIHFIGIGGISMSGLAEILLGRGFHITGSDSQDSALLTRLRNKGAEIFIGQSADNIKNDCEAVVYTAAIHPDNPEFVAAKEAGIPMLSRADLLGEIMQNYRVSIAVDFRRRDPPVYSRKYPGRRVRHLPHGSLRIYEQLSLSLPDDRHHPQRGR